jgi:hypothetical protein
MPVRGGESYGQMTSWVSKIISERNRLLSSPFVSKEVLDDLLVKGLDGEFPEEFPELTDRFFKGNRNPTALAIRAFNRWMRRES